MNKRQIGYGECELCGELMDLTSEGWCEGCAEFANEDNNDEEVTNEQ